LKLDILNSKSDINFDEVTKLFSSAGGDNYYENKKKWEQIIQMSSYIAYARDKGELICFGRVFDDGELCSFYDICIHPAYQRYKITSIIMNYLIEKVK